MNDKYSCSIRSRSNGNKSALKFSGTLYSKRAGAFFSYGPNIHPPLSSLTYHFASASLRTGCSSLFCLYSISLGSSSVTIY